MVSVTELGARIFPLLDRVGVRCGRGRPGGQVAVAQGPPAVSLVHRVLGKDAGTLGQRRSAEVEARRADGTGQSQAVGQPIWALRIGDLAAERGGVPHRISISVTYCNTSRRLVDALRPASGLVPAGLGRG